jgi:surface polysaccharide O-acyltransferase-like enzyme
MNSMVQDTLKGKIFFLSSGVQWFISTYIVLYLLSPYLNAMLGALSRNACRRMLVLTGILWCLIPTISWIPGFVVTEFQGSDLTFFLFLYCLGAYLRLYHESDSKGAGRWFLCAAGTAALCIGIIIAVDIWNNKTMGKLRLLDYLFNYQNHVLILLLSLFLFLGFKELKVANSPFINLVSSLTFGIYLIHDNWQIRRYLWNSVINGPAFQESPWFILVSAGTVMAVFCVCGAIELVRQLTVEKLWMKAAGTLSRLMDKTIEMCIKEDRNGQ